MHHEVSVEPLHCRHLLPGGEYLCIRGYLLRSGLALLRIGFAVLLMKNKMSRSLVSGVLVALLEMNGSAFAAGGFTGKDYSGVYICKGQDSKEGPYDGKVTLKLVPDQSSGPYGAYAFTLEVPGYGDYPGFASAFGNSMGIYFANTDPSTQDYGAGIATFSRDKAGRWHFTKFYYEPAFKGGNHGTETCVQTVTRR